MGGEQCKGSYVEVSSGWDATDCPACGAEVEVVHNWCGLGVSRIEAHDR